MMQGYKRKQINKISLMKIRDHRIEVKHLFSLTKNSNTMSRMELTSSLIVAADHNTLCWRKQNSAVGSTGFLVLFCTIKILRQIGNFWLHLGILLWLIKFIFLWCVGNFSIIICYFLKLSILPILTNSDSVHSFPSLNKSVRPWLPHNVTIPSFQDDFVLEFSSRYSLIAWNEAIILKPFHNTKNFLFWKDYDNSNNETHHFCCPHMPFWPVHWYGLCRVPWAKHWIITNY